MANLASLAKRGMSTAFGPRTINAYASFEQSGLLKPWQYNSRPLGDDDVEIKITHCGICGGDLMALDGGSAPRPCVVGHSRSRDPPRRRKKRALGAAKYYDLSDPEDVKKAAQSVDMLLVTVASPNLPYNTYISLVRKLGTLVVLGVPPDNISFNPMLLVGTGVRIVGNLVGSIEDVADTLKLAAEKNV